MNLITALVLLAALSVAAITFAAHSIVFPHGEWDAWAMWNLRARFFFYGFPDRWPAAFSNTLLWSAPDYPLLMSLSIARTWTYIKSDSVAVPIAWAAMFSVGVPYIVGISVGRARGSAAGMFAAAAILSSPAFVRYAPWQIADVPLSFFIVASLVLMARATLDQPQTHGWWFVAGVSSGLAAWTKNEGLLFVLVLVGLVVGATICRRPIVPMKAIGALVLGMSPAFLALAALKFWWAPPNSITSAQSLAYITDRLADLDRLQVISTAIGSEWWHSGGAFISPIAIVAAYALLRGQSRDGLHRLGWLGIALSILATAGYILVYLLTPHDLRWHLDTSLGRVSIHYLPLTVWSIMVVAR